MQTNKIKIQGTLTLSSFKKEPVNENYKQFHKIMAQQKYDNLKLGGVRK